MSRMTVAEAAEHFNVSKEAIHNRIRRGTLDSIIENGVKYVVLQGVKTAEKLKVEPKQPDNKKYYDYIEKENERLKEKVDKLESETLRLRDQREAMLIAEREKIEQIYKERDEQLKSILQVFASKLLPNAQVEDVIAEAVVEERQPAVTAVVKQPQGITADQSVEEDDDDDLAEEEIEITSVEDKPDPFEDDEFDDLVTLKDFMKLKDYSKKRRQRIKERFKENASEDARILVRSSKLYLRPYHYDYSDLLE